jgi:hypothetical protein
MNLAAVAVKYNPGETTALLLQYSATAKEEMTNSFEQHGWTSQPDRSLHYL